MRSASSPRAKQFKFSRSKSPSCGARGTALYRLPKNCLSKASRLRNQPCGCTVSPAKPRGPREVAQMAPRKSIVSEAIPWRLKLQRNLQAGEFDRLISRVDTYARLRNADVRGCDGAWVGPKACSVRHCGRPASAASNL